MNTPAAPAENASNFIRELVAEHVQTGKVQKVATRFPPEPNGYLHIGHAKSIVLNFGIASEFGGTCNLRFDDTDPVKEDVEYVDSIMDDVRWLGAQWDALYYASDYFEKLYEWAVLLIKEGKAYIDESTPEQIREMRGNFYNPGVNSPYRDRPIEESLALFARMRAGEFEEGKMVLRAKIDMAHPNMNMRDPLMYRIKHATHHRTGDAWCIYPMYDYAHPLSDAVEDITHSLCTLEFEDHRPLYDWFVDNLPVSKPQQIEFARLNLSYTVMSKRRLLQLVKEGHVAGWDDPRMPTICGMRRRGYTPEALRRFCERIGVAKNSQTVEVELLEHAVREHLNDLSMRVMAVLRPLKVVIENYPEGQSELLEAPNHPTDASFGVRQIPFGRELYIEQSDFMLEPPPKFYRLAPGREVRLRYGYFLKCHDVVKNDAGEVVELRCTYDPETKGGKAPDGRRSKVTIHWVSAAHALPAKVRMYDRLFSLKDPMEAPDGEWKSALNPNSLELLESFVEPELGTLDPSTHLQFERMGYFCFDKDSTPEALVFNRSVSLRDEWEALQKRGATK
ncbi:MAG: glutamine--tRNA ligase/YqeY domain fusion protein [Myxococcota bacterium]|jgi:glutaminyl-tRNA synthetase|nr:glutamine--tRNA ligase/YqeY domain fusion protein [Myxococcota bacterium]